MVRPRLSVGMAEAFAEYLHKPIRGELGLAAEEARDYPKAILAQGYHCSRYSFGYAACPTLTTRSSSRGEPAYALSSASAMM